jgi:hypothetical protein
MIGDGSNDDQVASETLARIAAKNSSIILDLFGGLSRNSITCPTCQQIEVQFALFTSVQVPIPQKRSAVWSVTFVPYDRLGLPTLLTIDEGSDIAQAISAAVGRDVNIRLATKQYGTDYRFGEPSSSLVVGNFAFEVPDDSKIYTVLLIKAVLTIGARQKVIEVSTPLLLEIPDEEVATEIIESLCGERLRVFWTKKDLPIPPRAQTLDFQLRAGGLAFSDKSQKFSVTASGPLSTTSVRVTMNSEHMREERGFNWGLFLTINGENQSRQRLADAIDLTDCLMFMTAPEVLSEDNKWHCDRCNGHVQAVKSFSVCREPPILILHLARFVQIGAVQGKLDAPIAYPDVLDFAPLLARPGDTAVNYRLFGVVEHYGTLSAGHYVAICWVEGQRKWMCFNDSGVRPALSAASPRAYILFYRRMDDNGTVE